MAAKYPEKKPASKPQAVGRLMNEKRRLHWDDYRYLTNCEPEEGNILVWRGTISGPTNEDGIYEKESPYRDGRYDLWMRFPPEYPYKAPVVKFTTKMFHPHVFPDGTICSSILQYGWSPTFAIPHITYMARQVLAEPELRDPVNHQAAHLLRTNPEEFEARARQIAADSLKKEEN